MRRPLFACCTVLLGCLAGCRHLTFACDDRDAWLTLTGFARADVNELVLRQGVPNSSFRVPLDSIGYTASATYRQRHDTLTLVPAAQGLPLRPGYDWQLRLPRLNRVVRITEFVGEHNRGSCTVTILSPGRRECMCYNELLSARLDGKPVTFAPASTFSYSFFRAK